MIGIGFGWNEDELARPRRRNTRLVEASRDELEPFAGQISVVTAAASSGAVDYFLGRLAETGGDHERAAEHFRARRST